MARLVKGCDRMTVWVGRTGGTDGSPQTCRTAKSMQQDRSTGKHCREKMRKIENFISSNYPRKKKFSVALLLCWMEENWEGWHSHTKHVGRHSVLRVSEVGTENLHSKEFQNLILHWRKAHIWPAQRPSTTILVSLNCSGYMFWSISKCTNSLIHSLVNTGKIEECHCPGTKLNHIGCSH